jgi:hypothetical protein
MMSSCSPSETGFTVGKSPYYYWRVGQENAVVDFAVWWHKRGYKTHSHVSCVYHSGSRRRGGG